MDGVEVDTFTDAEQCAYDHGDVADLWSEEDLCDIGADEVEIAIDRGADCLEPLDIRFRRARFWTGMRATVVPVGVTLHRKYDIDGEPEGALVCVVEGNESVTRISIRHELSHLVDWCRRGTTGEYDDEFVDITDTLWTFPNGHSRDSVEAAIAIDPRVEV